MTRDLKETCPGTYSTQKEKKRSRRFGGNVVSAWDLERFSYLFARSVEMKPRTKGQCKGKQESQKKSHYAQRLRMLPSALLVCGGKAGSRSD